MLCRPAFKFQLAISVAVTLLPLTETSGVQIPHCLLLYSMVIKYNIAQELYKSYCDAVGEQEQDGLIPAFLGKK